MSVTIERLPCLVTHTHYCTGIVKYGANMKRTILEHVITPCSVEWNIQADHHFIFQFYIQHSLILLSFYRIIQISLYIYPSDMHSLVENVNGCSFNSLQHYVYTTLEVFGSSTNLSKFYHLKSHSYKYGFFAERWNELRNQSIIGERKDILIQRIFNVKNIRIIQFMTLLTLKRIK